MRPDSRKYLHAIRTAAERIRAFTDGRDIETFAADALVRSAVERQFEIVGEALAQLARRDAGVAERISEHGRIIAFRNMLIHGYTEVDARIVWGIVVTKQPRLRDEVERLSAEPD